MIAITLAMELPALCVLLDWHSSLVPAWDHFLSPRVVSDTAGTEQWGQSRGWGWDAGFSCSTALPRLVLGLSSSSHLCRGLGMLSWLSLLGAFSWVSPHTPGGRAALPSWQLLLLLLPSLLVC